MTPSSLKPLGASLEKGPVGGGGGGGGQLTPYIKHGADVQLKQTFKYSIT